MSEIEIKLTKSEALVLFELLNRFSETDILSIEHPAEKSVLWNLTCILESSAPDELFDANYKNLLIAARKDLLD